MATCFLDSIASAQCIASFSMLLYTLSFLPQIIENYRHKSGKGLSDYFLLAYLHTYIVLFFYIFILNFNIAYKIACPLQALAILVLITQRLYYDRQNAKALSKLYFMNTFSYIVFIPFIMLAPLLLGHIFGWVSFLLSLINQLPQVFKVYLEKSTRGFSYSFVLIMGLAGIAELYAAVRLGLPLQTIFTAGKGVLFFIIFSWLFFIHKKSRLRG